MLGATAWEVSPVSGGMGLRLVGAGLGLASYDIVSSPTQDGSIQATPEGLIAFK